MKSSSVRRAEEMKARNNPLGYLSKLAGVKMTFSKNCVSGFIGNACQCWRCKTARGEEVTSISEKFAQMTADRLRYGGTAEERAWKLISRTLDAWNITHGRVRREVA